MNITCIPQATFFDSPELLSTALHTITVLSTPLYFFGIYIILTKTPKQMKGVKWYLLNLHVWIIISDYSIGLLTIPFLLLPEFAGYPLGILQYAGVSTINQTILVVLNAATMIASITIIFESRFFNVCSVRIRYQWKKFRKPWIASHYIFIVMMMVPWHYFVPDQIPAKQKVFQKLPCLPRYIYEAPVFVLTENYVYHLSVFITFLVITGLEIIVVIGYVGYTTFGRSPASSASIKTHQIQKSFFVALLIETAIPIATLTFPFVNWLVCILKEIYIQWITNLDIFIITLHGTISTFAMLIAHRPYREAILKMIPRSREVSVEDSRRVYFDQSTV